MLSPSLTRIVLFTSFFISATIALAQQQAIEKASDRSVVDSLVIDQVWAGHAVGFSMLTNPPHQFVAYYDSARVMTIAQRRLNKTVWKKQALPETLGWDSHNYITMALDRKGYLHVSGNMHADSLVYFQASTPYDVSSLTRKEKLIGDLEHRVTYPRFFPHPTGDLIFTYRDGGSGNGNQVYNRYNPTTQQWSRLLDEPLVDGGGERNAYIHTPVLGPDNHYHLIWVWRETPDAATNHDLSYARSKDLVHWEQSDGTPQPLPITLENGEIVAPVPVGQGMINGNIEIGFDFEDRPVVTYHKFDEAGHTQVYNARREAEGWVDYPLTDWNFRWHFGGNGSLNKRVDVYPIVKEDGKLTQQYYIDTVGVRKLLVNADDLLFVNELPIVRRYPERLDEVRATFPGMQVSTLEHTTEEGDTFVLRWETLSRNRDRPREGEIPQPSPLVLYHTVSRHAKGQ